VKKKEIEKYFKGKKITQMGIGGFGRALKEAEFLLKYGADLIITDSREAEVFPREIKALKKAAEKYKKNGSSLQLFLGREQKKVYYKNRDLVFYPNGAKPDNQFILYARKNSKLVTKSVAYLF
jgi:UDP-N-acetylmuramoylalanine-D-glutamate ligase